MALKKSVILRRLAKRGLEGRTTVSPLGDGYLIHSFAGMAEDGAMGGKRGQ